MRKAEGKGRTKAEVDEAIRWLMGCDGNGVRDAIAKGTDLGTFFAEAPAMNPKRSLITGVVCGMRVEDIADPRMKALRQLDKLVDELAKGKPMGKVLRQ